MLNYQREESRVKEKFLRLMRGMSSELDVWDNQGYLGKWVRWSGGWMQVIGRCDENGRIAE